MTFLYPTFLFALGAIAIPVIIHLFNFRKYKTVYFSNVKFLNDIKQETKAKSQLKHLLILLCRILAITALVFAFAQPFIPVVDNQTNTSAAESEVVCVYVDNSFSMDAESNEGKLLEAAKNRAAGIVDAYPPNSRFLLISNDFEIRNQRLITKEQFIQNLGEVQISPNVKKQSEIVSRLTDILSKSNKEQDEARKTIYIISDFQKSVADLENIRTDSLINLTLVPLKAQQTNNLYIDSCWFETPARRFNQPEELFVKIVNNSSQSYQNIPVKFFINDTVKALGSFNVSEKSAETVKMSYTNTQTGILQGRVEITDYPITYDNSFFLSYTISKRIPVLSIFDENNKNNYIKALFNDDGYIDLKSVELNNVKTGEFKNYQTIILEGAETLSSGLILQLKNYIKDGGTFVLFPSIMGDILKYNNLLKEINSDIFTKIDSQKVELKHIDYSNEIFQNVFRERRENISLPTIYKHFVFSKASKSVNETILKTLNEHSVLSHVPYHNGRAYLFSIPLDKQTNTFVKHPLFVPVLFNIVLYSATNTNMYYTIGRDNIIELNYPGTESQNAYHIINRKTGFDFIPQKISDLYSLNVKLNLMQNIKESGNYSIALENRDLQGLGFNYDRSESELSYFDISEIRDLIRKYNLINTSILDATSEFIETELENISKGRQLWVYFVLLVLLFLAGEIALIRLWK